ncbi:hypothetical protein K438DRAFT_1747268 [Mycena galopus ATCC 62051]|nr:hypothetical protein K438DRAFT_1747268 [Mycena galopus ATCC 62051]
MIIASSRPWSSAVPWCQQQEFVICELSSGVHGVDFGCSSTDERPVIVPLGDILRCLISAFGSGDDVSDVDDSSEEDSAPASIIVRKQFWLWPVLILFSFKVVHRVPSFCDALVQLQRAFSWSILHRQQLRFPGTGTVSRSGFGDS